MALARSASGPGGLSINTGAANLFGSSVSTQAPAAGSLFGSIGTQSAQSAQPSQTGGLFGTATSQPAQPTTSLFGSSTATAQPQQGGGLFGGSTQTVPAPATGGLFGSTAVAAQQPQQAGSGLFGSAATQQVQQSGGLFGSTGTQQQQQPQTQAGGLFAPAAQTQQTGGLFGGAQAQQPAQTGGLFSGSIQQQPQQSTGGIFGGSTMRRSATPFITLSAPGQQPQQQQQLQQPQQQQAGGIFGGSTLGGMGGGLGANPTSSIGAGAFAQSAMGPGLTMGQSTSLGQQQQQQVVPGVRIDLSNLKGTTRFNDLQEDLQNELVRCDTMIQRCMEQKSQVEAFLPAHGESIEAIPRDVKFVSRKYDGAAAALGEDAQDIKALRELVRVDADNARLSFKAVDNLKLPPQYHTSGLWTARQQESPVVGVHGEGEGGGCSDLINFFSKTGDDMDEQLRRFEKNLGEIEAHMRGVESNLSEQMQRVTATKAGAQASADHKVAELAAVLRDFEESILKVAGEVGGAREGMTALQLGSFLGT